MFLVCCKVSGLVDVGLSPCLNSHTNILIFSGIRKFFKRKYTTQGKELFVIIPAELFGGLRIFSYL